MFTSDILFERGEYRCDRVHYGVRLLYSRNVARLMRVFNSELISLESVSTDRSKLQEFLQATVTFHYLPWRKNKEINKKSVTSENVSRLCCRNDTGRKSAMSTQEAQPSRTMSS